MEEDMRLWSTNLRGLIDFHEWLLKNGVPSTSARYVQQVLKHNSVYPARDFPKLFTSDPPDAFFTYHSSHNFVDIENLILETCNFAARNLLTLRPEAASQNLEGFVSDGIRLWIDYLFIDQCARDIPAELEALPQLLRTVKTHFVLGDSPLNRAWCCYEIALFNECSVTEELPTVRSFFAPTDKPYFGWEMVETTEPTDKEFIAKTISSTFPGGSDGFDRIMAAASGVAVLNHTEPIEVAALNKAQTSTYYTPASLQTLGDAVGGWYDRYAGGPGNPSTPTK